MARLDRVGVRQRCAGRRREAVRAGPRLGAGAERDAARRFRRAGHLPDRPLPRQGAGAEPPVLPLRQLLPRADLESQLHRSVQITMAESFGVKGRGAILRGGRGDPRRRAEPSAPGGGLLAMEPPAGSDTEAIRDAKAQVFGPCGRSKPADVVRGQFRGLPERGRASRPIRRSRHSRRCDCTRFVALGRRPVPDPRRQAPPGHRHRGTRRAQATPAGALRRRRGQPRELLPVPAEPARDSVACHACQTAG